MDDSDAETERNQSTASTVIGGDSPKHPDQAVDLVSLDHKLKQEETVEEPETNQEIIEEPETKVEKSKPKRKKVTKKKPAITKRQKVSTTSTPQPNEGAIDVSDDEDNKDIAKEFKKFSNAPKYDMNSEELYCVCRRTDNGELMVACDGCDEWFHFKCMKLNMKNQKLVSNFFCRFCVWQGKGETLWLKKCRVSHCLLPIAQHSKYCSKEHGLLYLKENLFNKLLKQDNLLIEEVKTVLDGVEDFDKLQKLGLTFPSIEIRFEELPNHAKEQLEDIDKQLKKINEDLAHYELRKKYATNLKEKTKMISDKLTISAMNGVAITSKNKKKIEICGYDYKLNKSNNQWMSFTESVEFQEFISNAISIPDELISELEAAREGGDKTFGDFCSLDKRKCLKHNSWINILNEELHHLYHKLHKLKEEQEEKKVLILKDHDIQVYEKEMES